MPLKRHVAYAEVRRRDEQVAEHDREPRSQELYECEPVAVLLGDSRAHYIGARTYERTVAWNNIKKNWTN